MTRAPVRSDDRVRAPLYDQKSARFAQAARENAGRGHGDPAVANAVNAVMNVVDSLCGHYRGQRNVGDAHHDGLGPLRSVDEIEPAARKTLEQHLAVLLNVKSLAQYEVGLLTPRDADEAVEHMERALKAARQLPPVRGWEARA